MDGDPKAIKNEHAISLCGARGTKYIKILVKIVKNKDLNIPDGKIAPRCPFLPISVYVLCPIAQPAKKSVDRTYLFMCFLEPQSQSVCSKCFGYTLGSLSLQTIFLLRHDHCSKSHSRGSSDMARQQKVPTNHGCT